jgi:hypothetical protein
MVWNPSATARTPSATACSVTPATELGVLDRDLWAAVPDCAPCALPGGERLAS